MVKCSNCGAEIREGMRFCTHCGSPLHIESKEIPEGEQSEKENVKEYNKNNEPMNDRSKLINCPSCGRSLDNRLEYCTFCGAKLRPDKQEEHYLGGLSSANLLKGSFAGYSILVTNRRIIGIYNRAGVIAGTILGAAAGNKTGITIGAGVGYRAGAKSAGKTVFPPLEEIINKSDFQIYENEISRIELMPPYYINGGSMVIYTKKGDIIGIKISNEGYGEFERLKGLLSNFFHTKPVSVIPGAVLPRGKLFIVENPNKVSKTKRKISKGTRYVLVGLGLLPAIAAIFIGIGLVEEGIILWYSIGTTIAGLLVFAFGLLIYYYTFRGRMWRVFLIILAIETVLATLLVFGYI